MAMLRRAYSGPASGLTLIELLVTVAVLGILMGLVVAVLDPVHFRNKAQDGRRLSDLATIQTTLELSFAENNRYPAGLPAGVPTDPDGGSYAYCPSNMSYKICAGMETLPLPDDCGSAAGCSGNCCLTSPF